MITIRCTKEALAEAVFRVAAEHIGQMKVFDKLAFAQAVKKDQAFSQMPVRLQAICINLADEVISEFEE